MSIRSNWNSWRLVSPPPFTLKSVTTKFANVKELISLVTAKLEKKVSAVAQPEGALRQGSLGEPRQEGENIGRAQETQLFNRHKHCQVCAAQQRGCGLQTTLGELAASQAAVTKLRAKEKDAFAKNQKDLEDGIERALRWVSCATAPGEETNRMKQQARTAQESLDCLR